MIKPQSLRIAAPDAIEKHEKSADCHILDMRSTTDKKQSNWKITNALEIKSDTADLELWAETINKDTWLFFYCA
ncbi:hypothetical protein EBX93_08905 [bacterium]|nr:hypothetical protein [bacterium]